MRTVYDNEDGDFKFTKRAKPSKTPATRTSKTEQTADAPESTTSAASRKLKGKAHKPDSTPKEDAAPKTVQKKPRGKLPSSPAENAVPKTGRTKRTFQEIQSPSPKKPSRAQANANHDRSPSPGFRPVTVKKKRQNPDQTPAPQPKPASGPAAEHAAAPDDDKTTKIALPFADTPIIKRNKEMRKASADSNRRSSSGMRGRRASSLIDEGRGNGEFGSHNLKCAHLSFETCQIEQLTDLRIFRSTTTPRSTHSRVLQAYLCSAHRTDTNAMSARLVREQGFTTKT